MPDADDKADRTIGGDMPDDSARTGRETRSQRRIASVGREEMMGAIRKVFTATSALDTNEAVRAVARELGFTRAGARVDEAIRDSLSTAVRRRILSSESGKYALCRRDIGAYSRDELIAALLSNLGRGWTERDEAIRAAARWLGFQRAGRAINDAFKSVINGAIRRGLLEYEGSRIRKIAT